MKVLKILIGVLAIVMGLSISQAHLPVAPLVDGEVSTLFRGTATWVVDSCQRGEVCTYIFRNPAKDILVFARPLVDGFAFTVTKGGQQLSELPKEWGGQLINITTWTAFHSWLTNAANGFEEISVRAISASSRFTIIAAPAWAVTTQSTYDALGIGVWED